MATGAYQVADFAYQGVGLFAYQGPAGSGGPASQISFFSALTEWDQLEVVNADELVSARIFSGLTQIPEV